MTMNRRERRRHGRRYADTARIELTSAHARVLQALVDAPDGCLHEAQLARDLGMSVEDVRRLLHELTLWGLVAEGQMNRYWASIGSDPQASRPLGAVPGDRSRCWRGSPNKDSAL